MKCAKFLISPFTLISLFFSSSLLASSDSFIITVTTNPFINDSFTIPTRTPGWHYNYHVDCESDGTYEAQNQTGDFTCYYPATNPSGIFYETHQITIDGDFSQILFNNTGDKEKIISVDQWGTQIWGDMSHSFYGASNLVINASDSPNLSQVYYLIYMFRDALFMNQDISAWDVSNVRFMNGMFQGATSFNQDISSWNTSNVTDMSTLFNGAEAFNQDIGSWDVSSVESMHSMFRDATHFNQDIGGWDVSNVETMSAMFFRAVKFNQDISDWDIANVSEFSFFIEQTNMSVSHYDNFLIELSKKTSKTDQYFKVFPLSYCNGVAGRSTLINVFNWNIVGDGEDCSHYISSSHKVTMLENQVGVQGVKTVTTTGMIPSHTILGGADSHLFDIDIFSGWLHFKQAPSFSNPKDKNKDNVYRVRVQSSAGGKSDVITVTITIIPIAPIVYQLLF